MQDNQTVLAEITPQGGIEENAQVEEDGNEGDGATPLSQVSAPGSQPTTPRPSYVEESSSPNE